MKSSHLKYLMFGVSSLACLLVFQNFTTLQESQFQTRESLDPTRISNLYCNSQNVDFGSLNCQIPFSSYRARDGRVIAIERNNDQIVGTNLVGKGKARIVRTAEEFNSLSGKLEPGSEIILRNQTWKNQVLNFHGVGTAADPIIIRSETRFGASFEGASQLSISGAHIIIYGLEFKNVIATEERSTLIQLGIPSSQKTTCNFCVLTHSRVYDYNFPAEVFSANIENYIEAYDEARGRGVREPQVPIPPSNIFVKVYGQSITVAHSDFRYHLGRGRMIQASYKLPNEAPSQLHLIRNYFGNRPYVVGANWPATIKNGFEILMLGGSHFNGASAFALIENNVIQKADGEAEIFTIKASDVIIRFNTFRDNLGSLTLRKSNRTLVEGNYFIGGARSTGETTFGGLRVIGGGHWVVNNQFIDVGTHPTSEIHAALSLMSATVSDIAASAGKYHQASNVMVANNTFSGCKKCVVIGTGYKADPTNPQTLLPMNVGFMANAFTMGLGSKYFTFNAQIPEADLRAMLARMKFKYNLFTGSTATGLDAYGTELGSPSHLRETNPLVRINGRLELADNSRGIDKGVSLSSFKRFVDMDNQKFTGTRADVGADEKNNDLDSPKLPSYLSTLWQLVLPEA